MPSTEDAEQAFPGDGEMARGCARTTGPPRGSASRHSGAGRRRPATDASRPGAPAR